MSVTVLDAGWIVPVEPAGVVLTGHSLVIGPDGRIAALLPTDAVAETYPDAARAPLARHVLIPGLVNAHTHTPMNLLRGAADDLPLMTWLNEHIWPLESRWVGADFVRDGTRLALAEMLRGGTTCCNDMYFFPDVTAEAVADAHMRACVGLIVFDFPTAWGSGPDEYFARGTELAARYRDHSRVRTAWAPHAPYTVSDAPLREIAERAAADGRPIHMHVHETADEVAEAERRTGERPLARLDRLGLLSPRLLAVHMTQLTEAEMDRVAEAGTHVVHCPESNLKLASGFCPVAHLLARGVNVALGTDGAASNNDLDMLGEIRTAALLAKAVAGDATAVPAHTALRMATLNGARALGLDADIGSLEPGKQADVAAVSLDEIEWQPVHNPVSQLAYAASRQAVTDVWIGGRRVLDSRRLTTLDEAAIAARTREWADRLAIRPPDAAPHLDTTGATGPS